MKSKLFGVFILVLAIVTSTATYKLIYGIAEDKYFDKMFYKKSVSHGYSECSDIQCIFKSQKGRTEDISNLITSARNNTSPTNKVLGVSNDSKEFNVAVIGDSYVFGTGVLEKDRFQNLLEKKLTKTKKTNVYSFALPGDSVLDNYYKYKLVQQNYQIDLYIFVMIENDLLYWVKSQYDSPNYDEFLKSCSNAGSFVFNNNTDEYQKLLVDSLNSPANKCVLERIIPRLPHNAIYFSADWNENYEGAAVSNLLTPINNAGLRLIFRSAGKQIEGFNKPEYWDHPELFFSISSTELHPSKLAHEMYAEILYKEITGNSRWNFQYK